MQIKGLACQITRLYAVKGSLHYRFGTVFLASILSGFLTKAGNAVCTYRTKTINNKKLSKAWSKTEESVEAPDQTSPNRQVRRQRGNQAGSNWLDSGSFSK